MRYRKILKTVALLGAALSISGCKKRGDEVGGEATIQIKAYKGGYGTDFLHEIAKKFVEMYPNYKVQFLDESAVLDGEKAAAEISVPKKNQTDLYFVTGVDINYLIKRSSSVLGKRDQTLLEPLDDIFEGKAININKQEETQTIKSRFFKGFEDLCRYNGEFPKWRGKMFTLPWAESSTGLFMNKTVLDRYNIDIPLTSNEFILAVEKIYAEGGANNNYAFSWGGSNASGYWQYLYETWFAQYSGVKAFNNFMNCDPGNGKIREEGYKVYEDAGILKSFEAMFPILDLNYSPNGSRSMTHIEAQTDFINGKTAFMINGDWILNEMKGYYYEQAKNIQMIGAPILSSIGTEIGLSDAQLHSLVVMIDEHKTNDQIKTVLPSLSDANIARVRNARSVHDTIGIGHNILIPSYSDAKDAAKLFVKFMFSNDGCRIFRNFANANLPLTYEVQSGDSNTLFQQSLDKIRNYDEPTIVTSVASYNGVRDTGRILTFNSTAWATPYTFLYIMLDKASSSPAFSPSLIYNDEKAYVHSQWTTYMAFIDWL